MENSSFPRIRDKKFSYSGIFKVSMVHNGRFDLAIGEEYGTPTMYKAFAAANEIKNPMALRGLIRPYEESIRNELILKGFKGAELEREYRAAIDSVVLGSKDWLGYNDNVNGILSDAEGDRSYVVPTVDSVVAWHNKYNEVHEEEE